MTPYEVALLLDIHSMARPLEGRDEPILKEALDGMLRDGVIDQVFAPRLTPKGLCLVQAICATPMPVCVWKGANDVELVVS